MTLYNLQTLIDDEGNILSVFVKVDPSVDIEDVESSLENKHGDNIIVITCSSDLSMTKSLIEIFNGVLFSISLLYIVIDGITIINSMFMSVLEKTREIGVLKTVGWPDRKILLMIICESIVLIVIAAIPEQFSVFLLLSY